MHELKFTSLCKSSFSLQLQLLPFVVRKRTEDNSTAFKQRADGLVLMTVSVAATFARRIFMFRPQTTIEYGKLSTHCSSFSPLRYGQAAAAPPLRLLEVSTVSPN
eukprot:GHVU01071158.1.p1 GENE.GHVU01071158.1~~GHVU01071158.1.p1  ORF type:complete len:105 (+),score=4.52 GHVU01071158.1:127-441(+)